MFSKRKSFPQYKKFNKAFIESFVNDLNEAGFSEVQIKLPYNLIDDKKDTLTLEEFINRGRNYPSLILIAKNEKRNEKAKILFVNISSKAFFHDDTFPSGHSEPPELYVESPDPARTFGLFGYFYDYLRAKSLGLNTFLWLSALASFVFIIYEINLLTKDKPLLLERYLNGQLLADVTIGIVALLIIFQFLSQESGLYVKERGSKPLTLITRALKGEFRDNPIISLIIGIIGGIIVLILGQLLKI